MSPQIRKIENGPGRAAPYEVTKEMVVNSDIKQVCDTLKTIASIAGIVLIEYQALKMGHNGVLIAGTIGAIAGLGGYKLAQKKFQASV